MTDFFVRPWEISENGKNQEQLREQVKVNGEFKSFEDLRKRLYENIIDEMLFIARASDGAVSVDWLMTQPVFIRKKYVKEFQKEIKEREAKLNKMSKK